MLPRCQPRPGPASRPGRSGCGAGTSPGPTNNGPHPPVRRNQPGGGRPARQRPTEAVRRFASGKGRLGECLHDQRPIDLGHRTSDVQPCPRQVKVGTGQAQELAVTKGSEDGQEHHGPVAMLDDAGEAEDLVEREHGPFGCPIDARSLDPARVPHDDLVVDGRGEDGPAPTDRPSTWCSEERTRLGAGCPATASHGSMFSVASPGSASTSRPETAPAVPQAEGSSVECASLRRTAPSAAGEPGQRSRGTSPPASSHSPTP